MRHFITISLLLLCFGTARAQQPSAEEAVFSSFSYTGNDERFNKQIDDSRQFFNPIISGFAPDPAICRVGETFFLVNSSFTLFPGVPIYKSKDLVNWHQIGHVLDRSSQLSLQKIRVSGGIYAPSIAYNKRNKTFYMITTNVDGIGNFFVKTKDPEQGWSDPIRLPHVGGIDPSFFFDENGRAYIVNNDEPVGGHDYNGQRSIFLHRFDMAGDSTVGDQIEILRGGTHVEKEPIWIEGPHLFKVGKYYYLMCAEGGTGSRHSEVILRSRHPEGPWQEYEGGNPILTQRDGLDISRPDPVTCAGHADLVQAKDGKWWAVFLGCRPYETNFYNTGRDTYLLPVSWNNGWPTILPHAKPVPTVVDKANLDTEKAPYLTGNFSYTDRFMGEKLAQRWYFLRNPEGDFWHTGNGLRIHPKQTSIMQQENPAAVFVKQQHECFEAETELTFSPASGKQLAGMVLVQNEQYNFVFGKTKRGNQTVVTLTRTEKNATTIASAPIEDNARLRMKIIGKGRYYDFLYAVNDAEWQTLARGVDAVNLSTSRSGGFIGTLIGLYATLNN